jgi:outer membrane protein, multidrug efflux system
MSLPAFLRGDSGGAASASFADRSWQSVFSDPSLAALIGQALQSNPDLIAATYRIQEARAQAAAARADWFPAINAGADAAKTYSAGNPAPGNSRNGESYSLGVQMAWEIDLWGAIRRGNQAARARLLEAEYRRAGVHNLLVASVASAYVDLVALDERLAISRRTAESRQVSLDLVKARRDGGVSSDLEVGQAEALLGQARVSIPITERAITAKENEIRVLLGAYPGAVTRGKTINHLAGSLNIRAGLPSALLERRPDIAAANQAFQAATADIGVAEAMRLPTLSLTGRGGFASRQLEDLLQGRSGSYSLGPDLAGPLFDAGRRAAAASAARARAGMARAEYDRVAKQAFREAADSLDGYRKTGEIIAEREKLVASLQDVARVAKDRFQGGSSSYLEVLDAERSLFIAELDLADARRDHLLTIVQAYRALGGGWK